MTQRTAALDSGMMIILAICGAAVGISVVFSIWPYTQIGGLKGENNELQNQITQLQSQVAAIETQNNQLQSQVDVLETENNQLKGQINVLETEKMQLWLTYLELLSRGHIEIAYQRMHASARIL